MSTHYFGTISGFTIPYTNTTGNQSYLNDYEYNPPTGYTSLNYRGLGSSRLSELKKYGSTGYTQTLTHPVIEGLNTTGYTFTYTHNTTGSTVLQYYDLSDGTTIISGSTTGFTKEEVINYMLTRNEHFLGFVEQPQIYSDVFVNRGKLGVMERNFKLGEIENTGELDIYGNGYFKVKKQ
jgi:hypothetical protein